MTRVLMALVAAAALALPAAAVASDRHPTLAELEGEVMCPTCHTTLDESNSPIAQRIKVFIRREIAAGKTKSQIEDELVAEFGPSILAAPPKKGFDLLAWLLPLAGVAVGAVAVGVAAWRWSRAREREPTRADVPLDPDLERRLEAELRAFET